ncbi:hypothetical protein F4805DRAFT_412118 [Annulohypoxylon moriforme]|nr:hypothetical protein F4805DRAFT_412118 [Annulohypoxylon moriforme]
MSSLFDFGEKTRMVGIQIRNGDVFYFHENILRHHSSYLNEQIKVLKDEDDNVLRIHLDWECITYEAPDKSDPDPQYLAMKLFTKWIYRYGSHIAPNNANADWIMAREVPNARVLVDTIILGWKLKIKLFQDAILLMLAKVPFTIDDSFWRHIRVIRCIPILFTFVMERNSRQLQDLNDIDMLHTQLLAIEAAVPRKSDESSDPCSSQYVIAATLKSFTTKIQMLRQLIEEIQYNGVLGTGNVLRRIESIWPEGEELLQKIQVEESFSKIDRHRYL